MDRDQRNALALALLMLASTVLVWLPFLLNANEFLGAKLPQTSLDAVKRYWDGPLYAVVSRTFYSPSPLYAFGPLPPYYYSAHFAVYPLSIRLLSLLTDPLNAMLLSTLLFSIACVVMFYYFVKEFKLSSNPLWLSAVFVFFPARWLIYHSVGASEPPFLFFSLASLYFFKKDRLTLSAVFGALAAGTRIIGLLLLAFYGLWFVWKKRAEWTRVLPSYLPYLLIPAAVMAHFAHYQLVLGDFFSYFKVNLFVVTALPFQAVVNFGGPALGEYWMLLYLLYGAGIARLWQQKRHDLALFSFLLYVPVLFFSWNDVARYLLPAAPLALLIAFDDVWQTKWFRCLFPFLVYGFYLQAWSTIPTNLMPADQFARLLAAL